MWLPDQSAHQLDVAMKKMKFRQVDLLLEKVFKNRAEKYEIAGHCPVCQEGLVHKILPYLEIIVKACPGGHGVWMNPKACAELGEIIHDYSRLHTKKRYVLLTFLLISALIGTLNLFFKAPLLPLGSSTNSRTAINDQEIGLDYWPIRDTSRYALPLKESSITNIADLYYLKLLTDHLDIILSNRINMDRVLGTEREPGEYRDVYTLFRNHQYDAAQSLQALDVPEKFRSFHMKIYEAVKLQLGFYADYVEAKARDASYSLRDFMEHPALIQSSQGLHEAWEEMRLIYPEMDSKTRLAIESRLCWSDIL